MLPRETALPLAESAGDLETQLQALTNVADVYLATGELEASLGYRRRQRALAEKIADPEAMALAECLIGCTLTMLGDWLEARNHLEMARSAGASRDSAQTLSFLGGLDIQEGDWETGTSLLEEASRTAEQTGDIQVLRLVQLQLSERDLLQERLGAVLARLEPMLADGGADPTSFALLPNIAVAHLEMGDAERAEDIARQAVEQGGFYRLTLVDALRALGLVLVQQGRWNEAETTFSDGLSLARDVHYPLGEARMLLGRARLHASRGEPERAEARLREAAAIFHLLGARPHIDAIEREQRP
ncbi:MAG: tetratricopeptide repeat protein [Chloroflexota bacterium]